MTAIKPLLRFVEPAFFNLISGHVKELVTGIQDGTINSDEDAISLLYPSNPHARTYLSRLKAKTRRLLIGFTMVSRSREELNETQRIYQDCYQLYAIAKIMINQYKKEEGIRICEKTLKKAIEYDFTELAFLFARELRMHYAVVKNDARNFHKFDQLCKYYNELISALLEVETLFCHIVFQDNRSRAVEAIKVTPLADYQKVLARYDHLDSNKLKVLSSTIRINLHFSNFQYQEILKECNRTIAYFENRKGVFGSFTLSMLQTKARAFIPLGNYDESKELLKSAIKLAPQGSFNWSIALLYRVMVCFHQGQYQEAYDVYKAHTSKKSTISPALVEQWHILEAYIKFFIEIGQITPYEKERFRLAKFLNEVPIFAKDKAGNNIAIHIIRTLFQLRRKLYGKIICEMDALRQYNNRYLKKPETRRAYFFIKMLLQLPRNDFHKQAVLRKTAADFDRLKKTPLHVNQNFEIELVPFENLWEEVLALLDSKFHRSRAPKSFSKSPPNQ